MKIPFARPLMGEAEAKAVQDVLNSGLLTEGPNVARFEEMFRDYCGGGLAVAVSSCTAALHLSWLALGIKPGDRVYIPAMTHAATAHAVIAAGGEPVFVDCGNDGNIEPVKILDDIDKSRKTGVKQAKGICVVHFLGKPCLMGLLNDIADRHNMKIVEDCAHALGSAFDFRHVGLFGDTGCFSFYPSKTITTGEGGMVLTRNRRIADKIRKLRAFGKVMDPDFDVRQFGLNYRMSEMHAAIGCVQMKRLQKIVDWRRHVAGKLFEQLYPRAIGGHLAISYIATSALAAEAVRVELKSHHIEPSKYFPKPVPLLDYYKRTQGHKEGDFPMAEEICARSVTLPVGPQVAEKHIDMMVKCIRKVDP